MMLGSCIMDPTIYFVENGFGKAYHWALGRGLIWIFMEIHAKVNLACRAKPYMEGV